MKLSVIVPFHSREPERLNQLQRGLQALADQVGAPRYQTLVVDDGSPLAAREAIAALAPDSRPDLLEKPNGGLASARNHGAAHASGDVLVFMDDDILPCPGFLAHHAAVHQANDSALAFGSLPWPPDLKRTPFLDYLDRQNHYDLFARYGDAEHIPLPALNGNSSVRRHHFEAAGGYDLDFSDYGGEDTELGHRLVAAGLRFVYAPDAIGYHYHTKGFREHRRDQYSSGRALVRIARKHPELVSRINLDIVSRGFLALPWSKRLQRLVWLGLRHLPPTRGVLGLALTCFAGVGLSRAAHPLYKVLGHYELARGIADALDEGGPLTG